MYQDLSDPELRQAMTWLARLSGLELDASRIETVLPAFRNYRSAIERFSTLELDPEVEPALLFRAGTVQEGE